MSRYLMEVGKEGMADTYRERGSPLPLQYGTSLGGGNYG